MADAKTPAPAASSAAPAAAPASSDGPDIENIAASNPGARVLGRGEVLPDEQASGAAAHASKRTHAHTRATRARQTRSARVPYARSRARTRANLQARRDEALLWSRGDFDPTGDGAVFGLKVSYGEGRGIDDSAAVAERNDDVHVLLRGSPVAGAVEGAFFAPVGGEEESELLMRPLTRWCGRALRTRRCPFTRGSLRTHTSRGASRSPTRRCPSTGERASCG